jgi:hypothetical protein
MEFIGGLILLAIVLVAAGIGFLAKMYPADTRPNEDTGISEQEWSDAIR